MATLWKSIISCEVCLQLSLFEVIHWERSIWQGKVCGAIQGQIKLDQVPNLGQQFFVRWKTQLMNRHLTDDGIYYVNWTEILCALDTPLWSNKNENNSTNATSNIRWGHASNRLLGQPRLSFSSNFLKKLTKLKNTPGVKITETFKFAHRRVWNLLDAMGAVQHCRNAKWNFKLVRYNARLPMNACNKFMQSGAAQGL